MGILPKQNAPIRKKIIMNNKLTRSNNDVMVAGVAAGLAEYLDIDPVLVRLLFVLLTLSGGHGILVYLILWLIMPQEDISEKIHVS